MVLVQLKAVLVIVYLMCEGKNNLKGCTATVVRCHLLFYATSCKRLYILRVCAYLLEGLKSNIF